MKKRNSSKAEPVCALEGIEEGIEGVEVEKFGMPNIKLEKKFGQSPVFIASTLLEDGGALKSASPASLLKEAIHVISCGYEDKTEWGKEVWILVLTSALDIILMDFEFVSTDIFFQSRLAGSTVQLQRIY